MYYIIQEDFFLEERYKVIFDALDKLGLQYETVKVLPFVDEIDYKTTRKDVFVFGSVKLARIAAQEGWYPGSLFGEEHDYRRYREGYGGNMLNVIGKLEECNTKYFKFGNEIFDTVETHSGKACDRLFIRPCRDSKIFNGGIYTKQKWEDLMLSRLNEDNQYDLVMYSLPKTIYKEARLWIVGGEIVTSSYYKFHGNQPFEEDVDPEGLQFAKYMTNVWSPASSYCMDICLTPDGWKIVELNCINCSGFYKGDMQKVLIALEDYYS